MSFLHPEFLYYMLPIIFILFGLLLTQKEAQASFFSQEVMEKLRVSANTLTLKARNALFMLISSLVVIALAGPVIKDGKVEIKAKSADIMIALDISDSMLAQDVYPNRLKLAKQKALEFLKLEPNERMGVIAFAKNSYLVSPLSFDHDAVGFLLRQLDTNSITEKGTDFLTMLEVVHNSVKKETKKYLLILSDGGDERDFSREIAYAKEKEIVVFILGIGTKKGAPIKKEDGEFVKLHGDIIVTKLNSAIASLATKTGGVYIQNLRSLKDVKAMLSEIDKHTQKKELKSEEIERFIPLFYFPLGVALLLLLIATSSMSKREKVALPSIFVLFVFLFNPTPSDALLLDFLELKKAKKAYESGEYKKSAALYGAYAEESNNGTSLYNQANALYKDAKYTEAISTYQKAKFDKKDQRAKNFANLGNAYVKEAKKDALQNAIKSYESSLELVEDKEVRENLEAVKKAFENKKENQNNDKKEQNKEKKEKQKENTKNKNDNQEEKKDKKKESQKNKDSEQNKDKQADSKSKKNKRDKEKKRENKQEDKKLEELKKEEKEQQKQKDVSSQKVKERQMSDAEEKKWLKALNKQQNTYMYMLNKENKLEEDSNEKPW